MSTLNLTWISFGWVGYGWISLQLHLNHCPTIEKFQLVGKNREEPQNDSTINPESLVVWSAPSNTRHFLFSHWFAKHLDS